MTTPEAVGMLSGLISLLIVLFKVMTDKSDPTGLITALRQEVTNLRADLEKSDLIQQKLVKIQERLVKAIMDNLNERQEKLKNNPGCQSCLGADVVFIQEIRAIVSNGDAEKTQPVKGQM